MQLPGVSCHKELFNSWGMCGALEEAWGTFGSIDATC